MYCTVHAHVQSTLCAHYSQVTSRGGAGRTTTVSFAFAFAFAFRPVRFGSVLETRTGRHRTE